MAEYLSKEKDYLLKLARRTLETYLKENKVLAVDVGEVPEKLREERGVFVTLEKSGQLRGCIGYILPQEPIYQAVINNAINAAVNDSRFLPVSVNELNDLTIEISILTLPQELKVASAEEYLSKLRPEIDGVIIEQGRQSATYLPQVWSDIKEPERFLFSLCQKAGLTGDCWQKEGVKIFTYQAWCSGSDEKPHSLIDEWGF